MANLYAFDQIESDLEALKNKYHQSLLKMSWSTISRELTRLNVSSYCEDLREVETYYNLYRSLTMEDLAKPQARHAVNGMAKVVAKMLANIDNLTQIESYLYLVGRIHDIAGVDLEYIGVWALGFCSRIDRFAKIQADVWKNEAVDIWKSFFRVLVDFISAGYTQPRWRRLGGVGGSRLLSEQKCWISDVWVTFQEHVLHYLSNALLLPLIIRSNRTLAKYFLTYESTLTELTWEGSSEASVATLEKTKHAAWFLTEILKRLVPNLDNLERCEDLLENLGRRHAEAGVAQHHLDLLALVYVQGVRSVVACQGIKGGPLFDATKAWIHFLRFIVVAMKRGYLPQD